jgi:penicillin-binding protein 1A
LRRGLATSTNLITARVMKRIGPNVVCEWARKMGITSPLDCVPSLALGTTDLSVYELTSAYCTFANKGVYNEPLFVTRIEDRNGNVLVDFQPQGREAISENTAYMMIDMLRGVVNEPGGTGGRLRGRYHLPGDIGGKTGTTQKQSDGWFMGVTPYLVGGTWVGCSERTMRFSSLAYGQGASLALPIFGLFMQKVYADSTIAPPKDKFPMPKGFDIELDCSKYASQKKTFATDSSSNSIMNPDND